MALKLTKDCRLVLYTTTDGGEIAETSHDFMIKDNAFKGNTKLKEIMIPDDIKEIRDGAFEGCTSLTTVKLPESIDIIRPTAFKGCTALETIVLPDSVKRIECWIDRRVACETLYRPFSQEELIEHLVSGRGETEFYLCREFGGSWRDWN